MGILFAVGALFAWGIGDFLIQRSTREFGDWIALFYITAFGAIFLLPFAYRDIPKIFSAPHDIFILLAASLVLLFGSVFNLRALRVGKISVIAPIFAFEVLITALLGIVVIREFLSTAQIAFTALLVAGIFLVSLESHRDLKKTKLERGVGYAILGTVGMGSATFLFGLASRATTPIFTNWFASVFLAIAAVLYLGIYGQLGEIAKYWRTHKKLILALGAIDNGAWVLFSYATLFVPIAVAAGISECYIAVASGLGVFISREKLNSHQYAGLLLTVLSVVLLSLATEK